MITAKRLKFNSCDANNLLNAMCRDERVLIFHKDRCNKQDDYQQIKQQRVNNDQIDAYEKKLQRNAIKGKNSRTCFPLKKEAFFFYRERYKIHCIFHRPI